MKRLLTYTLVAGLSTMLLSSCGDKRSPGWEYMPDMVHSQAYDAYSPNPNFKDGTTNRHPVKGTVPLYQGVMGNMNHYTPYPYANTIEGYDSAGLHLKNPIALTPDVLHEGERIFGIYCSPCHGLGGKGDGSIVVNNNIKNPFPPPPSYFTERLLTLPEGKMYHTIHHGRNLMGSYSSQINNEQIWTVVHYVRNMQQHYNDSMRNVISTPIPQPAKTDSATTANANNANTQSR